MEVAVSKYKKHQINSNELLSRCSGHQLAQRGRRWKSAEAEGPQSDPRIEEVRLAQIELKMIPSGILRLRSREDASS